ncbi:MAG: phosphoribosylanthranilate isomerase [Bacteroidota bacterium]
MSELFVKICGITNLEDALFSVESGADALGFIFYNQSPRCVEPETVQNIVAQLPKPVARIGVFVNPTVRDVTTVCQHIRLTSLQVYGNQTDGELQELGTSVIKAFQVEKGFDVEQLRDYSVEAFLLDTFVRGKTGGTGRTFDWKIGQRATKYGKVILSGGLNPDNVAEAVRLVHPYGVDVCSGVEERPGKKDLKKVKEFIQKAKSSLP